MSRGQGTKSKQIFPSPAAQSFLINGGGKDRVFARRATLVPATPRFIIKVRNRSYLRRFSDCEFARFVSIRFPGSEQCGHDSAAFGV